jgi:hypothetical protein
MKTIATISLSIMMTVLTIGSLPTLKTKNVGRAPAFEKQDVKLSTSISRYLVATMK